MRVQTDSKIHLLTFFPFTVNTDPWISCPIDRVEELEPDKSTVVLGFKWQLPRTNMKTVVVSPSNYDENYPFPVGRHRVTWIGISDSGTQKSCSFYVTVNGEFLFLSKKYFFAIHLTDEHQGPYAKHDGKGKGNENVAKQKV